MTTRERAEIDQETAAEARGPLPTFVTIDEAAASLGVSYHTIWRRVRSGELPATRIGRVVRIDVEDLAALRRQGPRPSAGAAAAHARPAPRAREPRGEFARRARGLDAA